jgi:hypothetical protein
VSSQRLPATIENQGIPSESAHARNAAGGQERGPLALPSEAEVERRSLHVLASILRMKVGTGMTVDPTVKAEARELAMKMLGPFFDYIRLGIQEERRKGVSEAEIQRKISRVIAEVETRQRGKVDDDIVNEMILLLQEAAMPPHEGPFTFQLG